MERKDRQREVETGQASGEAERFVTDAYRKQMEIESQGRAADQIEEQINEKKTANAETGMMGFYRNFMTKNTAVGGSAPVEDGQQAVVQKTTRDKIEDKLKELKDRQEAKVQDEKRRKQDDRDYDDDPFKLKNTSQNGGGVPKQDSKQGVRRSRSREGSNLQISEATTAELERKAKVEALKARYQQRQSELDQK